MAAPLATQQFPGHYFHNVPGASQNGLPSPLYASTASQDTAWSSSYNSSVNTTTSPTDIHSPFSPATPAPHHEFNFHHLGSGEQSHIYSDSRIPKFQTLSPATQSHFVIHPPMTVFPQEPLEPSVGPNLNPATTRGNGHALASSPYPSRILATPSSPEEADHQEHFHPPDDTAIVDSRSGSPDTVVTVPQHRRSAIRSRPHKLRFSSKSFRPGWEDADDSARNWGADIWERGMGWVSSPSPDLGTASTDAPRPRTPIRRNRPKGRLTDTQRREICQYHDNNPNVRQEDIAKEYGVERSTISKILKYKSKWLNLPLSATGTFSCVAKSRASLRRTKWAWIDEGMLDWMKELSDQSPGEEFVLSDSLLRKKAKEIAEKHGEGQAFKASAGWLENFKRRHNIVKGRWVTAWHQWSLENEKPEDREARLGLPTPYKSTYNPWYTKATSVSSLDTSLPVGEDAREMLRSESHRQQLQLEVRPSVPSNWPDAGPSTDEQSPSPSLATIQETSQAGGSGPGALTPSEVAFRHYNKLHPPQFPPDMRLSPSPPAAPLVVPLQRAPMKVRSVHSFEQARAYVAEALKFYREELGRTNRLGHGEDVIMDNFAKYSEDWLEYDDEERFMRR